MRKLVSRLQAHTHREDTDRPRLLRSLALISLYLASSCSSSRLLASCSRSASSSRSSVESESTLRKLQLFSPILQLRYVLTRPLSACDLRRRPSVRPVRPHHHRRRRLRRHLQRHMCCTPSPHAALHALNSLVWGSRQQSVPCNRISDTRLQERNLCRASPSVPRRGSFMQPAHSGALRSTADA